MYFLKYVLLIILLSITNLVSADSQLKLLTNLQILSTESFTSMIRDPQNPAIIYGITPPKSSAVVMGGALYKSTDAGQHWAAIHVEGGIFQLAIDPSNSDILYAIRDTQLIKSINGGLTWTRLDSGYNYVGQYSEIVIHPLQPTVVYVRSSVSLYKSTDSGKTWAHLALPTELVHNSHEPESASLVIPPNHPELLYLMINSQLFKSEDAGITWPEVKQNLVDHDKLLGFLLLFKKLWTTPSQPDVLYLDTIIYSFSTYTDSNPTTYKSLDGGKTWQQIPFPKMTDCAVICYRGLMAVDPYHKGVLYSSAQLASSEFVVYRSVDEGNTWELIFRTLAGFPTTILSSPQNMDSVFLSVIGAPVEKYNASSTDNPIETRLRLAGQLLSTENAGQTWTEVDTSFRSVIMLGHPRFHPTNPKIFYAMAQDKNIYQTLDGGKTFQALPSFISGFSNYALNFPNDMLLVTEKAVFGSSYRWMNQTWQTYRPNELKQAQITTIGSDLYATHYLSSRSGNDFWMQRSRDNGVTWQAFNLGNIKYSDQLVVHPLQKNVIYSAYLNEDSYNLAYPTRQPFISQSIDDGITWQDISGDLPKVTGGLTNIYQLLPDPLQSHIIYIIYDGYLYKTIDNGAHWKRVGSDLLPRQAFRVWFDPENSQTLYCANVISSTTRQPFIYKSTDGGETWRNSTLQLQNENAYTASFKALRFYPDSGKMIYIAFTEDRIYKSDDAESWTILTDAAQLERDSPSGMLLAVDLPYLNVTGIYRVENTRNGFKSLKDTNSYTPVRVFSSSPDNLTLEVFNKPTQAVITVKENENISLRAKFEINDSDTYQQPASLFVVSQFQPANSADTYWFMQTADHTWLPWDGTDNNLQPAKVISQLQAVETLDIFTGAPQGLVGTSTIYTAYSPWARGIVMRKSDIEVNFFAPKVIISNQNNPLVLKVE